MKLSACIGATILGFALVASGCRRSPIIVQDEPDVFTASLPKFRGTHHGDGTAVVTVTGWVTDRDSEAPISGAKFSIVPTRSFSDAENVRVNFVSDEAGRFTARVFVGAAISRDARGAGEVYQTTKSKLQVEKDGYQTAQVLVDYEMPPLKILLKKKPPNLPPEQAAPSARGSP